MRMDIKEQYKDQLLKVLFYYMGQDLRQRLMLECPEAYNQACGNVVVNVVRESDGSKIVEGIHKTTIMKFTR